MLFITPFLSGRMNKYFFCYLHLLEPNTVRLCFPQRIGRDLLCNNFRFVYTLAFSVYFI